MPSTRYGLMGPERKIALDQMKPHRCRDIDDEPGPAGERVGMDAPAGEEISRQEWFELLDRIAPVYDGSRGHPAQRVPANLGVGVHRVGHARRNIGVLSLARCFTHHGSIGTNHPNPVDREALVAWGIGELVFGVILHRVGREDLAYFPVGLSSGSVGLIPDNTVVQE